MATSQTLKDLKAQLLFVTDEKEVEQIKDKILFLSELESKNK